MKRKGRLLDRLAETWLGKRFPRLFRARSEKRLDLSRRALLASGVSGLGAAIFFRLRPQSEAVVFEPLLIRPPGALPEREFLSRCVKCGECMKVCPTSGLQPTLLQAGLEGIWSPVLIPRIGYCEYECNLCGQICPTGAIEHVPLPKKKELKIGLAFVDRDRCLPWAQAKECIVCEEHCPTPTKAIWLKEVQVPTRDGGTFTVKQPYVDTDLCIGCGICEKRCPVRDLPAIRVTSAGETRHPDNQITLSLYG
jgi:MauM/NapG family ferredoxin protein